MMALEGHGIAFLPGSSVVRELKQKKLAPADNGQAEWSTNLNICAFREKPSQHRPGKPIVGQLWDYLCLKKNDDSTASLRSRKI